MPHHLTRNHQLMVKELPFIITSQSINKANAHTFLSNLLLCLISFNPRSLRIDSQSHLTV